MSAASCLARLLIPVAAGVGAYVSCAQGRKRWRMSTLYPPQLVCLCIAVLVLLSIGAAWAVGDVSVSKDVSYLILATVLATTMVLNCKHGQIYRQLIADVALFMITFLIYSSAECDTPERVMLAPAVCVFLFDLILMVQATPQ